MHRKMARNTFSRELVVRLACADLVQIRDGAPLLAVTDAGRAVIAHHRSSRRKGQ
jgi:hypothetical protein